MVELTELDLRALLDALGDPDQQADGRGIEVAVLDTGVEADHPWLRDAEIESLGIENAGGQAQLAQQTGDAVGHGTAVISRLVHVAPACRVRSIRILGEDRKGPTAALLSALHLLREHPPHLINLSLATQRPDHAMAISHEIDELHALGVTCLAARGYSVGRRDYPSSLAGVIGVSFDDCPTSHLVARQRDPVDFDAAGVNVAIAWRGGTNRRATGSSYACPVVTGLAARLLSIRPDLRPFEVRTLLHAYVRRRETGWTPEALARLDGDYEIREQRGNGCSR